MHPVQNKNPDLAADCLANRPRVVTEYWRFNQDHPSCTPSITKRMYNTDLACTPYWGCGYSLATSIAHQTLGRRKLNLTSGKAHKDSDYMVMISVAYRYFCMMTMLSLTFVVKLVCFPLADSAPFHCHCRVETSHLQAAGSEASCNMACGYNLSLAPELSARWHYELRCWYLLGSGPLYEVNIL